jgi:hypothetical protein
MSDEVPAPHHVNQSYRQRRELPPPTQPAIAHPPTGAAIRLRLIFTGVLVVAVLGLTAGAIAVARHRSGREQDLLRTGVAVAGRVVAQPFTVTRYGGYWGDDVQWSFAGQQYDDSTTLTSSKLSDLPSIGEAVTVLVDRQDPSWFALNGVFINKTPYTVSVALFVIPALIAFLVAIGLGRSGLRLRSVTGRYPWQLGTVTEVDRALRKNGRLRYSESKVSGEDPRLPITVRSLGVQEGKPVWVCLGDGRFAICRPGAFGLRCSRYRI